jgi:hypothetical protein
MAEEAAEVRSYGSGHLYVAPTGATVPTDVSTNPTHAAGWVELGHISDAGPRFSFGKARNPVSSWQSFPLPVRNLKAAAPSTVSYDLLQWNMNTFSLAMGGGTWSDVGGSGRKFVPADASDTNEKALIADLLDGDYTYRFVFYRTENQAATDFAATGSALAPLAVVSTIMSPDDGSTPWAFFSDDPNFSVAQAAS